jgi:hypothetical protein
MQFVKSTGGYYYKINKIGERTRISKELYTKI